MKKRSSVCIGAFAGAMIFAGPALADWVACESAVVKSDFADQIRLYTICLGEEPNGGLEDTRLAISNRGVAHLLSGDADSALADFNRALHIDAERSDSIRVTRFRSGAVYLNRARLYWELGDAAAALADVESAMEKSLPERWIGPYQRGRLRAASGDAAGALEDFDNALRRDRRSAPVQLAKALLLTTAADDSLRNGEQALELALEAQGRQDGAEAQLVLALAYAETGRLAEAAAAHGRATDMAEADARSLLDEIGQKITAGVPVRGLYADPRLVTIAVRSCADYRINVGDGRPFTPNFSPAPGLYLWPTTICL